MNWRIGDITAVPQLSFSEMTYAELIEFREFY